MTRGIVVWLVAIVAALFAMPAAEATIAAPAQPPVTYAYDSPPAPAAVADTSYGRVLPSTGVDDSQHQADGRGWVGTSARPDGVRTGTVYNYDSGAPLASVALKSTTAMDVGRLSERADPSLQASRVAAKSGADVAGAASHSPSFIVKPNGETLIVPKGAQGPVPVESGKGFQFRGGSGGHGLSPSAADVRIMDPVTSGKYPYPNGYASYLNGSGQTINPFSGETVGKSSPWWHWGFGG